MKYSIMLLALVLGTQSFAISTFPNSKWSGKGVTKMEDGTKIAFRETLVIKDNVLTWEETSADKTEKHVIKIAFEKSGFITGTTEGTAYKTTGYCGEQICHLQGENGKFELTMVFDGITLREAGSMTDGKKMFFEARLRRTL